MAIWLDVTTSLGWKRPVTGVVRVEVECARDFLSQAQGQIKFCRYDRNYGAFLAVDRSSVESNLQRLADLRGQVEGRLRRIAKSLLAQLPDTLQSCLMAPITNLRSRRKTRSAQNCFQPGDVYLSLGCDWDDKDMAVLRRLREQNGLRVMLCCHDIIPVVRPDLTLGRITARFGEYLKQMISSADHILCVSEHTRQDLKRFLSLSGAERLPTLSQIRHGSDLPQNNNPITVSPELAEILAHPFVLYVSTLEKRKNHGLLLDAYEDLIQEGVLALPTLVLVGMAGWGADQMVARLERLASEGAPIRWLKHVRDSDLNLLYRHCLMTVYPSLYEGWGLPVAESLAYGKFCLASSAASIPEVGGDLVDYLAPDDFRAWSQALRHYFLKPDLIVLREKDIETGYRPPTWSNTASTILLTAKELESSH